MQSIVRTDHSYYEMSKDTFVPSDMTLPRSQSMIKTSKQSQRRSRNPEPFMHSYTRTQKDYEFSNTRHMGISLSKKT